MHKSRAAVLQLTSPPPDTAMMSALSGQHSASLFMLCELLAEKKEAHLYSLVNSWCNNFEFKKGRLWQLLNINASNLSDIFDYKVLTQGEIQRAVKESAFHVEALLLSIENPGNWLDLWASAVSDHLENVTSTWMHKHFDSKIEEQKEDDGSPSVWPPAPLDPKIWWSPKVDFHNLENAFEGLENIFLVQDLDDQDPHFHEFFYVSIEKPLSDLKKMRELLVASQLPREASELAWCIFAEILLESVIKLQSLLLCSV